jgi:hypothetical protein
VGGLPTLRLPVGGRHSRTFPPVLLAMCPAQCYLRSAIRRDMSVTLGRLRISSFIIRSRRETPSIALSIAFCMNIITLDLSRAKPRAKASYQYNLYMDDLSMFSCFLVFITQVLKCVSVEIYYYFDII